MWRTALLAVLTACGPAGDGAPDGGGDASAPRDAATDAPVDAACTPTPLAPRSPALFDAIVAHLTLHETQVEGDWDLDFGDATAYAPPVLTAVATARCDDAMSALADATLSHEQALLDRFGSNLSGEALVGTLGLIETYARTGDRRLAVEAARAVELGGGLIDLFGGILPRETVEQAGLPYGQTATTGLLTAIELRYVEQVAPDDAETLAAALDHVRGIDDAMWSDALGYYRFDEGDDELHVYAQSAMMAVHALAGRLTGEASHLDRAEALFDAIAPAYRPELGAYHDPYQGTGDDYVSLSTTSYLLLGLHLLSRERPAPRYDAATSELLSFVQERLWSDADGIAYHDWQNGARAGWYCTGCNFQLAYLLLLLSP